MPSITPLESCCVLEQVWSIIVVIDQQVVRPDVLSLQQKTRHQ
jgi:hypothetical protein